MEGRFCFGAFDHKLDDYIGSPQMIGFVFASDEASLPATISKLFDMDCETYSAPAMVTSLGKLFETSTSCFVRLFFGSDPEQLAGAGPLITLTPVVTFAVDFNKAAVDEYLKNGKLSGDPPVIEGSTHNFVWVKPTAVWAWTGKQWQPSGVGIYLDGPDIQLSFFGDDIPFDEFDTPMFSDMTPNY